MKISAIIVTFNRKELLEKCFNAVSSQSVDLTRIYIIDNCSNDGTDQLVKKMINKRDNVEYIKLDSNTYG